MWIPDPTVDGIWFGPVESLRLGHKNQVHYMLAVCFVLGKSPPKLASKEAFHLEMQVDFEMMLLSKKTDFQTPRPFSGQ